MRGILIASLIAISCGKPKFEVVATCYNPLAEQTDSTPLITASGAVIDASDPLAHRWIAVSRDLEGEGFTFGKKVCVQGTDVYDGIWTVQDRMNRRWERRIDFLVGINNHIDKWDLITIHLID